MESFHQRQHKVYWDDTEGEIQTQFLGTGSEPPQNLLETRESQTLKNTFIQFSANPMLQCLWVLEPPAMGAGH